MNASERPLLAGSARVSVGPEVIGLALRSCDYTIKTPLASAIGHALKHADGQKTIGALAAEAGLSEITLQGHLDPLLRDGALFDTAQLETDNAGHFLGAYLELCDLWVDEIFSRPFWSSVLSGKASAGLVLGWGVEFQHFVSAANEYMAAGVAHERSDTRAQQWLAEHYVEEYDHADIFLRGLAADGLEPERVRSARPLATTRALTNYLLEVANTDTLAYAATFAVMQAPRALRSLENIRALYDDLRACYPFASGLLSALQGHAELDVSLGHEELVLTKLLGRQESISTEQRNVIVSAGWGLIEQFVLFFDGIYEHYGATPAPLLRANPDIRMYTAA